MARKRSTENAPSALSSHDEEEEQNDDVEEEESDVKNPVVVDKRNSSSDSEEDDDSDNTIPSPNISDFTIKPINNKPGSKRPPLTPESESMKKKKKEEEEEETTVGGEERPIIVLGLPTQQAASVKKPASNRRVRSEVTVKRRQLDKGKEMIDGKSKKLMEKMLEMYIKRTELDQQQTRLLLEELKSEKI